MRRVLGLIIALLIFLGIMFLPFMASGQELIGSGDYVVVKAGDPAAFDGMLFRQGAVASIIAKYRGEQLRCEKEIEYQKDLCNLALGKMTEQCDALRKIASKRYEDIIAVKDKEIKQLIGTHTYKYRFFDKPFWVGIAVGVVSTVIISFGSYYAWEHR
jgi:hypothetical protein